MRTHIDLFSGIGGFALACQWAGVETVQFVEIDPFCQAVLRKNFPGVPIHDDIKTFKWNGTDPFILSGGDPCPCRSKARSIWGSIHPDLSGYFLAVAARLRSLWVVRENVPASDDSHFCAALEHIGYRVTIVSTNSISFTAQNRRRDFIVGTTDSIRSKSFRRHPLFDGNLRTSEPIRKEKPACFCLTTHRCRYDLTLGTITYMKAPGYESLTVRNVDGSRDTQTIGLQEYLKQELQKCTATQLSRKSRTKSSKP